jgi:hypothetical protein
MATVVTAISNLIATNAATLGGIVSVQEKDEHPGVALESGLIPCAYILPIIEGKLQTEFDMGHDALRMDFPVTILLYYRSDDVNSFIATNRNYALHLIDIINNSYALGGWQTYKTETELGYWESSGDIVHYSITKVTGKLWF